MNIFREIKRIFAPPYSHTKTLEHPIGLFFIKKKAGQELFNQIELEDLNLNQEELLKYTFVGSSTIRANSKIAYKLQSLPSSVCLQLGFESYEAFMNFIKKIQTNILDAKIIDRIKDSYVIMFANVIPPTKLRHRISGLKSGIEFIVTGGILEAHIENTIIKYSQHKKEQLLDWGCGCGRVAIHLLKNEQINYTGCDIDEECIEWCKNQISKNQFYVNNFAPPTPFNDSKFTIVLASSVMTHLDQKLQETWLKEIHRILTPNGLFLATTLGEASANILGETQQFETSEYLERTSNAIDGIAPKDRYKDSFQTKAYTYKNWTCYFDILEYQEQAIGHQDLVIMRKKKI